MFRTPSPKAYRRTNRRTPKKGRRGLVHIAKPKASDSKQTIKRRAHTIKRAVFNGAGYKYKGESRVRNKTGGGLTRSALVVGRGGTIVSRKRRDHMRKMRRTNPGSWGADRSGYLKATKRKYSSGTVKGRRRACTSMGKVLNLATGQCRVRLNPTASARKSAARRGRLTRKSNLASGVTKAVKRKKKTLKKKRTNLKNKNKKVKTAEKKKKSAVLPKTKSKANTKLKAAKKQRSSAKKQVKDAVKALDKAKAKTPPPPRRSMRNRK